MTGAERTIGEWGSVDEPLELTAADHDALTELNQDRRVIDTEQQGDGWYIHARQYVGTIVLPDAGTIHIVPKAAQGNRSLLARVASDVDVNVDERGPVVDDPDISPLLEARIAGYVDELLKALTNSRQRTSESVRSGSKLDPNKVSQLAGPSPVSKPFVEHQIEYDISGPVHYRLFNEIVPFVEDDRVS